MEDNTKEYYIRQISKRGDDYGGKGGTYDLLVWCKKINLREVTLEDAKRFLDNPKQAYEMNNN